jgi:hypothetical protein
MSWEKSISLSTSHTFSIGLSKWSSIQRQLEPKRKFRRKMLLSIKRFNIGSLTKIWRTFLKTKPSTSFLGSMLPRSFFVVRFQSQEGTRRRSSPPQRLLRRTNSTRILLKTYSLLPIFSLSLPRQSKWKLELENSRCTLARVSLIVRQFIFSNAEWVWTRLQNHLIG